MVLCLPAQVRRLGRKLVIPAQGHSHASAGWHPNKMKSCHASAGWHPKKNLQIFSLFLVFAILFSSSDAAYAADISTVLNNLRKVLKPLTVVLLFISFLVGTFMIFRAIVLFKKFGMSMNMQTQPGEFAGPITYLIVGAALIYLPTTTDMMMNAIFGGSTSLFGGGTLDYTAYGQGSQLLGYVTTGAVEQQWADLANTLILYIQFLGLLSFIKGWIMLGKAGQAGAQPGSFSKAMTHIIGGIIAVNFVGMVTILRNTIYGS